jgi:SWI/SNF-related matrix-associated actin-dependent regulator 1 of chromatin subfamily A
MGLGKTIQVISMMNQCRIKKAIIVCPATVKINWLRELNEWAVIPYNIQTMWKQSDNILLETEIIIVNYDLLLSKKICVQIRSQRWDLIVCDEAHYLKNIKAARTNAVLGEKGIANGCSRKVMLTGTPVMNRPIELYPLLSALAPKLIAPYESFQAYAFRFCGAYHDGWTLNTKGASNLPELAKRIRPFMLRRTKADVLKDLPPVEIQVVPLIMGPESRKAVIEFEEGVAGMNSLKMFEEDAQKGLLAQHLRKLGLSKATQIIAHIKMLSQTIDKLIVFTHHRAVAATILEQSQALNPVQVIGGMTTRDKQYAVDTFISDPSVRLFIGQISAAGQGLDGLQKVCSTVIFGELDWSPSKIDQAIGRAHRFLQKDKTLVIFLVLKDTIEEIMMTSIDAKRKLIQQVIN